MRVLAGDSIKDQLLLLSITMLQPASLIIDHGHFQYNSLGLGLALGGAMAVMTGWTATGSILYCCALNHKHMTLYYAPAFFGYILGRCLQERELLRKVKWNIGNLILEKGNKKNCTILRKILFA